MNDDMSGIGKTVRALKKRDIGKKKKKNIKINESNACKTLVMLEIYRTPYNAGNTPINM